MPRLYTYFGGAGLIGVAAWSFNTFYYVPAVQRLLSNKILEDEIFFEQRMHQKIQTLRRTGYIRTEQQRRIASVIATALRAELNEQVGQKHIRPFAFEDMSTMLDEIDTRILNADTSKAPTRRKRYYYLPTELPKSVVKEEQAANEILELQQNRSTFGTWVRANVWMPLGKFMLHGLWFLQRFLPAHYFLSALGYILQRVVPVEVSCAVPPLASRKMTEKLPEVAVWVQPTNSNHILVKSVVTHAMLSKDSPEVLKSRKLVFPATKEDAAALAPIMPVWARVFSSQISANAVRSFEEMNSMTDYIVVEVQEEDGWTVLQVLPWRVDELLKEIP
eukprot:PhF_6_TR10130/c0_g1_i1/m.15742